MLFRLVEAVVGNVYLAVFKPLSKGRFAPVESLSEGLVPVEEFFCLLIPETEAVFLGICIQAGLAYCLGGEFGAGWKASFLVHQVVIVLRAEVEFVVRFENFVNLFKDEATKQFGSGWVWLVVDNSGKLQVTSTQNQDNPLMKNAIIPGTPILALDVWEHAYYLDYQYKRKNYIDAFFNVINWKKVAENYDAAIKK